MSQLFNVRRFFLLLRLSVLERPVVIFGACIAALASTALIYFFFQTIGAYPPAQYLSFVVGLIGGGCLLASLVFACFNAEPAGIAYLTVPGSNLEKWLAGLLIAVAYVLLFLAYYRMLDGFFVDVYHRKLNPLDAQYHVKYAFVGRFAFMEEKELLAFFLNAFCLMLAGSIHFNKAAFIKTALIIIGIIIAGVMLNTVIARFMLPDVARAVPLVNVVIAHGDTESIISLPARVNRYTGWFVGAVCPAMIILLSYLKLKEKEI